MKKISLHSGRILLGTILLLILWIASLSIAESIIPTNLQTSQAEEEVLIARFIMVCLIHVVLLYVTIRLSSWRGFRLMLTIFLLIFMIQYFLSMIEAIWFNDSLDMPLSGIMSILISGLLLALSFSPLMVWISGRAKSKHPADQHVQKTSGDLYLEKFLSKTMAVKISILVLIIYPALYFLAGYYIAWQSEAVRVFYTGSTEIEGFWKMLGDNIRSGLYGFQILRGLIWVALAIPVYIMLKTTFWLKGIITGLLFAFLMNAQHLIPNPYFPPEVTQFHFIETASSNFLWGFLIVLFFHYSRSYSSKAIQLETSG